MMLNVNDKGGIHTNKNYFIKKLHPEKLTASFLEERVL